MQLVGDAPFMWTPGKLILDALRARFEPGRSVVAVDDDFHEIVGALKCYSMLLTVPGGRVLPVGELNEVGVLTSHRRQGILSSMLHDHFADARRRGEFVSVLHASESSIYGRFGYGCAYDRWEYEIDTRHSAFLPAAQAVVDNDTGSLRPIRQADWLSVLPLLYTEWIRLRGVGVDPNAGWWGDRYSASAAEQQGDISGHMAIAHCDNAGKIDGFVTYSGTGKWENSIRSQTLDVHELVALNRVAYLRLWRAILDHDLVDTVNTFDAVEDEPLRWALRDPRRMLTKSRGDGWYVRLINVLEALNARVYGSTEQVVIAVNDPFQPDNSGTYCFDGTAWALGGAGIAADLACGVTELGAAYLGSQSLQALASVGRVTELTPGATARADRMFLSRVNSAR